MTENKTSNFVSVPLTNPILDSDRATTAVDKRNIKLSLSDDELTDLLALLGDNTPENRLSYKLRYPNSAHIDLLNVDDAKESKVEIESEVHSSPKKDKNVYKTNTQPQIIKDISTNEIYFVRPTKQIAASITRKTDEFCSTVYRQRVYQNFVEDLRKISFSSEGVYYRSAFLHACSRSRVFPDFKEIPDYCLILEGDSSSWIHTHVLGKAILKAVVSDEIFTTASARKNNRVSFSEFSIIDSRVRNLMSCISTFTPQGCITKKNFWSIVAFNFECYVFSGLIYALYKRALSPLNTDQAQCAKLQTDETIVMFGHIHNNGIIKDGSQIPLREYIAGKHLGTLAQLYQELDAEVPASDAPYETQMFSGITKDVEGVRKSMQEIPELVTGAREAMSSVNTIIDKAESKIDEAGESLEKISKLTPLFESIGNILAPLTSAAKGISNVVNKVIDYIKCMLKFLYDNVMLALPIVAAAILPKIKQYLPAHVFPYVVGVFGLASLAIYSGPTLKAIKKVLSYIQNKLTDEDIADELIDVDISEKLNEETIDLSDFNPTSQTSVDAPMELQDDSGMITLLAAAYCSMGIDPTDKREVISALKAIPSVSKGADSVIQAIKNFFAIVLSKVAGFLGFGNEFARYMDDQYAKWFEETSRIIGAKKSATIDITEEGFKNLKQHIESGTILAAKFDLMGKKTLATLMVNHLRTLSALLGDVEAMRITKPKGRAEPVSILLMGEPGHGKTVLSDMLAIALVKDALRDHPAMLERFKEAPAEFIHTMSSEHWMDDYHPNTIVIKHDEFPLTKETTPEDSQQVAMVDEVNTTQKALPMANADKKGKLYFGHRYSIYTSNAKGLKSEVLLHPNAMKRRVHIPITVSTKGNVVNSNAGKTLDPDRWCLELMAPTPDKYANFTSSGVNITVYDLIKMSVAMKDIREAERVANSEIMHKLTDGSSTEPKDMLYKLALDAFKQQHNRVPQPHEWYKFAQSKKSFFTNYFDEKIVDNWTEELKAREPKMETQAAPGEIRLGKGGYLEWLSDPNKIRCYSVEYDAVMVSMKTEYEKILSTKLDVSRQGTFGMDYNIDMDDEHHKKSLMLTWKLFGDQNPIVGPNEYKNRLELGLAVGMTFGKYHFFGYRIPMFESSLFIVQEKIGQKKGCVTERTTVRVNSDVGIMAGLLAQFFRKIGISGAFGLTAEALADAHYGIFDLPGYLLQKSVEGGYSLLAKIKLFTTRAVECMKESYTTVKSSQTYGELLKNMFKVAIQEPVVACVEALRSFAGKTISLIYNAAKKVLIWLNDNYLWISAAIGAVTSVMAVSNHFGLTPSLFDFEEQDSSSFHSKQLAYRNKAREKWGKAKGSNNPQIGIHWEEHVLPSLHKATWVMLNPQDAVAGYLQCLGENFFVCPEHFFVSLESWAAETDRPFLVLLKDEARYEISEDQIEVVKNFDDVHSDLIIFKINNGRLPRGKSILKHFEDPVSADAYKLKGTFEVTLVLPGKLTTNGASLMPLAPVKDNNATLVAEVAVAGKPYPVVNCIAYNIETKKGQCGAFVVSNGKICGIHTHGNGRIGQACRINVRQIRDALGITAVDSNMYPAIFEDLSAELQPIMVSQIYDESCRTGISVGYLERPNTTFTRENLTRWNEAGPLKPTVVPVNAKAKNYPVARKKYGFKPENIDEEVWERVADIFGHHFCQRPNPNQLQRLLSTFEAIRGLEGTSIDPLDQTTSPGWPYNYEHIKRKDIFEILPDGTLVVGPSFERLTMDIRWTIRAAANACTPMVICSDQLKYELRAPEKFNNPRMVSGAPLHHTIVLRIFFAGAQAHYADSWIHGDALLAVNPYLDANVIERQFLAKGGGIRECCGDYSAYDASRSVYVAETFAKIMNRFYKVDNDSPEGAARIFLARSCVVTAHVFDRKVDLWGAGLASGVYITSFFNSICGTLFNMYCCAIKAKELGMDWIGILEDYFENVSIRVLGDDVRFAVSEKYAFHNNMTISEIMSRDFSMVYTSATKAEVVVPFDEPEDRFLLKRQAVWCAEDDCYYWALKEETIINMVCYTKTDNQIEIMNQRVDNAIRELSFHSSDVWNRLYPLILEQAGQLYKGVYYSQKSMRRLATEAWRSV